MSEFAPGVGVVADRRLHPATLVSRTLRVIPEAAGGMAAYGALIARADLARVLLMILAGILFAGIAAFLSWWRFRYGVGEREIVIESGVISRKRRVIPFERVQDIAIEQRLLARLFGTAHVKIETGGSAADEGHLDSITLADAHALRDIVRGRKAAEAAAEAEAEGVKQDAAEPVLFEMGLGRVLFSGLFNFSVVFVAAIFAVLQNGEELGLIEPTDFALKSADMPVRMWVIASLVTLGAVLLLGMAAGVIRTLARDYGFRLTRAAAGLRRRRGLITLSEAVIPVRRMQVARIESGFIARALGWYSLDFQTLGADARGRGAQAAAPFARIEEVRPILAETGFPEPGEEAAWRRAPRRSIVRRALFPAIGAAAALAAAFALAAEAGVGAVLLLLLALAAPLRWTRHRHLVGDEALFVAGGVIKHRVRIMPFARAQAIEIRATPFQRLLRLASIRVDTAGAPNTRGLAIVDLDAAEAAALAERLLALFQERRRIERAARS
ncbi:MAG TPA: PH domain-containing protein [Allosphingosinicella sp.]|nr:PH domain-containing protein [Allosphingosinicella sp.]